MGVSAICRDLLLFLHIYNCLENNVIYYAMIRSKGNPEKIYIGITVRPWKQSSYSHKAYLVTCKQHIPLKVDIATQNHKLSKITKTAQA